ncbi:uncharacterized protein [Maniola hyperantus]|uniref:uncharacterized protein n=1 Tax=Aphantopus hyperantus TaxID=2795564 RepID=UPI00374A7DAD
MMVSKDLVFILVLYHLVAISEPARILAALPVPMPTHQMVFRVLLQELVKRGHHVTVITGVPSYTDGQAPVNYTEINVQQVMEVIRTNLITEELKISDDLVPQFLSTFKISVEINDKLFGMKVIQDFIRNTESTYFDLIFVEDCFKSSLIFTHIFNAPVIHLSSFGGSFETFEAVGAATHPFLYPLAVRQRYTNLSVWEKLLELHVEYRLQKAYHEHELMDNDIFKKYFGINAPTIDELKKKIQMIFLNIHPIWDSNRPVPPNVIYLGGLHQKVQQEIPKELKSSLDSSTNGVIYVSFGTNVNPSFLPPEKLQIFINVFSKLPYDVFWKWNDENLPGLTKNIKVRQWFPQSDLLRHPKIKLFITQGGLHSTDEAIVGNVPLIGIPMMWDQWHNVNKYVQLKIGLQLDINFITENKLREAIQSVIKDKSYKENIIKLHSVMRDQLQSPLERAVWWTEYVIRNRGAEHLRAPSANLTWVEYYEVKLVALIMISLVFMLVILTLITLRILRVCKSKMKTDYSYHLYADDLQLYISFNAENALDSILKLNRDLEAIRIWTVNHGLLVNPSKTQVMLIGRPRSRSAILKYRYSCLPETQLGAIFRFLYCDSNQAMERPSSAVKMRKKIFLLVLWHLLTISRTAKILAVLPAPVLSHQIVFRVLTQELAKRGHEVTIITALPLYPKDQMPVNYTEITVDEKVNDVMKHLLTEEIKISEDLVSQFVRTFKAANHITEGILDQKDVQNLLREKRTYFDLIFLEDCGKSLLVFSHLLKAPVIQISSFGGTFDTFEAVGALTHPILYPLAVRKRYHNLSAWEKISELLLQYRVQKAYNEAEILDNELMKKHFGRNTPTLHELKRNIHMLFLNIHPIWDSNRPVPSNVIYLGGLHQKPQQELPKELKSNLDTSLNGIIYVSFGTNVNPGLLPPEKLQIFINVFSKLPYDVYWKWNDENLPGLTKNIKVLKWFPQADLLQHPKVKLFITQGGLQSTDEAIAGGVPLIGIPFIWDQWFNVEKYVQLKIGLQLDINSITETKLRDSIETILGDKRYKENIIKLQSVMHDQPQSPLEKAVWWTEYVIRHRGAEHLRAPTANMDWMEYYEIKLILYIAIPLILLLAIIVLLISRLFVSKVKIE